ncbi:MAG: glutathione S-transferase family protein [Pseudorhodoplanes sp.]|nr:MAG: glutathione S-transferase family protein [Pseudorhodoplanes sp.]
MYTLYSMQRSGNCYKVRLALAQLGIPYTRVEIDILKGETRTPDFLARNPSGHIPLLEIAPGRFLAESNAILCFLAERSRLLGGNPAKRAVIMQWLFFEQHAIVPNVGAAYFWLCLVKGGRDLQRHALDDWLEEGQRALAVMNRHLSENRYFAGERYSIADIAIYAYTHLAHHCDFDLAPFPALCDWLGRVAAEPGHIAMDFDPSALSAAAE